MVNKLVNRKHVDWQVKQHCKYVDFVGFAMPVGTSTKTEPSITSKSRSDLQTETIALKTICHLPEGSHSTNWPTGRAFKAIGNDIILLE